MGSTPNVITESINAGETLNTFLARAVSDGTWADVLPKVKQQRGVPTVKEIENGAVSSFEIDLLHDLIRDYISRAGGLALTYADVQTLQALGTDDGIVAGVTLARVVSGSWYKCTAVGGASSSTWEPVLGIRHALDYGAVGDGVNDDLLSLQAAVSAGGAISLAGGHVFAISGSLIVGSGVSILNPGGRQSSKIIAIGALLSSGDAMIRRSSTAYSTSSANRSLNVRLDGLWLDYVTPAVSGSIGIDLAQCTDAVVTNCYVDNCEASYRLANVCYYNTLIQCIGANATDAFLIQNGANGNSLKDCRALTVVNGLHLKEGVDGGVNEFQAMKFGVEGVTGKGVWLEATTAGIITGIQIDTLRAENPNTSSPYDAAVGFQADAGAANTEVRNYFPQSMVTDYNVNASAQNVRFTGGGGVRGSIRLFDGYTSNPCLLKYSNVASSLQVRNSVDSGYVDVTCGSLVTNGAASQVVSARPRYSLGTALVAGDVSLSAGWGTTASVSAITAKDAGGVLTVSSSGTGQSANPTLTVTFKDGAWATGAPVAIAARGGGDQPTVPVSVTAVTDTTFTVTFHGTPVDGETYDIRFAAFNI